jgi:endonuclease/exonuclease/phosphatase family metal-dependent hydrolase
MKMVKSDALPHLTKTPILENRGALWMEINVYGRAVQFINTHLSLFPPEGMLQVKALLGKEWLGHPDCKGPVIVCGDFNSRRNSQLCKVLSKKFHSIHYDAPIYGHLKTFPSFFPLGLVDHIFLGDGVNAVKIETPRTHLEKIASDHLPLIAEIQIKPCRRKNI